MAAGDQLCTIQLRLLCYHAMAGKGNLNGDGVTTHTLALKSKQFILHIMSNNQSKQ